MLSRSLAFTLPSIPDSRRSSASRRTLCCSQAAPSRHAVVIGAGVAGLSAARELATNGISVTLFEASDGVGGRVRTDHVDGFVLDRGFQVFIEGYPACREVLDYAALDLQRFLPGAVIRHNGAFHTISDPFRAPLQALEGLFAPVGTLADKLRVALLRNALLREPLQTILSPSALQMPLDTFLLQRGFTPAFISAFFRPFYQGIFLAPLSEQSSSMFQFVFRMFAEAPASLPANGIGSVTQLMREQLPANVEIHLNTPVTYVDAGHVEVRGEVLTAPIIVLATEGPEAVRLLGSKIDTNKSRGSICLYFASDRPSPVSKPILVLNGDSKEEGPVNNMFVPSQVAPGYAPPGKTLISTTIVGDGLGKGNEALEREVRQQMSRWFGEEKVNEWRLLAVYRIPHSQSAQSPDFVFHRETQLGEGLFVCGDHRNSPTLHGAIRSGQAAARQALDFVSIIDS